jgi:hypothetical protein
MLFPFLAPFLIYLDVALVFYPLVVVLIFLSILCLPVDLDPIDRPRRGTEGKPILSMFFNILVFGAVLYHFGINVGSWTRWLPCLGAYLLIGLAWSTAKWWSFCGLVRDKLKMLVEKFGSSVEKGDNATDVARSFMSYLFGNSELRKYKNAPYMSENIKPWPRQQVIDVFIPQVTMHKGIVLMWLFCWPMSILKWALADMMRDLYNGVFAAIKGWFQRIAANRFSDI